MASLPYPVASYPNDPLEIPVDTMTDIDMEIYHPGLVHHESTSGAQFFLRRGLPRWRGTASWAACYTNSERAGAMEGYLTSMSEGIYTSTLKHGREVLDVSTLNKRGDGIGKATLSTDSLSIPTVLRMVVYEGTTENRLYLYPAKHSTGEPLTYNLTLYAGTDTMVGNQVMVFNSLPLRSIFGFPYTFTPVTPGIGIRVRVDFKWVRLRINNTSTGTITDYSPYYRVQSVFTRSTPALTALLINSPPPIQLNPTAESPAIHKPGQVFKVAGTSSPRIYMVTSIDGDDITFTPEIDIFGTASSVSLDETEANGFITVRATPGATINLPRTRTLSGPWNMSWIEGVA